MSLFRGAVVAEERVERRLAAVFCADVAAYSRLMGSDEEGTLAALKSHRRELIDPLITQHQGRIVKTTGDGMLIEFASVVDAVRCAVVVQQGMEDRNANIPEDQRIRFRIGINLGDIIIDEGDIFGDGVNVAARLEALAEPGEICVSGAISASCARTGIYRENIAVAIGPLMRRLKARLKEAGLGRWKSCRGHGRSDDR